MFKKPFKTQKQNLVKRSDLRKLREKLTEAYPSLSETDLNEIIPAKGEVGTVTMGGGARTVIYTLQGQPFLFDPDGRGRTFVPTVYTLWKVPQMLPIIFTHAPVFKRLANGADLMLQGVVVPSDTEYDGKRPIALGDWQKGALCSICINGYYTAVGVGEMLVNNRELAATGMKGRGIRVLHLYKDKLWEFGDKAEPPMIVLDTSGGYGDEEEDGEEGEEGDGGDAESQTSKTSTEKNEPSASTTNEPNGETDNAAEGNTENEAEKEKEKEDKPVEGAEKEDEKVDEENNVNQDDLLEFCFWCGIKGPKGIKDKALPILCGTFYADFMLPARPEGTRVELKKTKYKKLSTFLESMEEQGIIAMKDLSPGVTQLISINRGHPRYREFVPPKEEEQENMVNVNSELGVEKGLKIQEFFKIPSNLSALVTAATSKELLSQKEALSLLWAYVEAKNLVPAQDKSQVDVDLLLATKILGKNVPAGTRIKKAELSKKFIEKLQPVTAISRDGIGDVKRGGLKPIQIHTEQRQGRKVMTIIRGVEAFIITPDDLRSALAKKFAASVTVQEIPGKQGAIPLQEILIQGNVANEAGEYLQEHYEVPKKYLDITSTIKKKGNKK